MLKKLKITNFKSHKSSTFRFTKGLNLIVGSSNSGKSAALQAFELLVKNRPLGGRYVHGRVKGDVEVEAVFDDCTIALQKFIHKTGGGDFRVKEASYHLNEEKVGSVIGSKIPDEVVNALNISDVNYQSQRDESFMITSSGGEFSKTINEFIGMTDIEGALVKVRQAMSKTGADIAAVKTSMKEASRQYKKYKLLPKARGGLKKLGRLNRRAEEIRVEIEGLDEFVGEHGRLTRVSELLGSNKSKFEELFIMEGKIGDVEDEIEDLEEYISLSDEYSSMRSSVAKAKRRYVKALVKQKICPMCFRKFKEGDEEKISEAV